jgi:hypothetical protein
LLPRCWLYRHRSLRKKHSCCSVFKSTKSFCWILKNVANCCMILPDVGDSALCEYLLKSNHITLLFAEILLRKK